MHLIWFYFLKFFLTDDAIFFGLYYDILCQYYNIQVHMSFCIGIVTSYHSL